MSIKKNGMVAGEASEAESNSPVRAPGTEDLTRTEKQADPKGTPETSGTHPGVRTESRELGGVMNRPTGSLGNDAVVSGFGQEARPTSTTDGDIPESTPMPGQIPEVTM